MRVETLDSAVQRLSNVGSTDTGTLGRAMEDMVGDRKVDWIPLNIYYFDHSK